MAELKPCPWGHEIGDNVATVGWRGDVQVECQDCGARGPARTTREAAIRAWNNRDVLDALDARIEADHARTQAEIAALRAKLGDAELDRDRVRGLSVREITILTERLQSEAARCEDLRAQLAAMGAVVKAARGVLDPKRWSHLSLRMALAALDEVRRGGER